jgi:hypothetical protein
VLAHLGPIGIRGWGGEVLHCGARRRPAGTSAAARGSGEEGARGGPHVTLGARGSVWTAPNDLVARDGLNYRSAASAFMVGGAAKMVARCGARRGGQPP